MIDALELSVPLDKMKRLETWKNCPAGRAKRDHPYVGYTDIHPTLRVYHGHRRWIPRKSQHYLLQFHKVGTLTADDFLYQVRNAFVLNDAEILHLTVVRVDFAADVRGLPVEWFRQNCRVRYKQYFDKFPGWLEKTRQSYTTLQYGKRPDLYRIYDKVYEIKSHKKNPEHRFFYLGQITGEPEPVVTRLERQCSREILPEHLGTLGLLLKNAATFDPFANLFFEDKKSTPDESKWNAQKWLMCHGLKATIEKYGVPFVRQRLKDNVGRYWRRYSDLVACTCEGLRSEDLTQLYKRSTARQLNLNQERGLVMDI